MNADSRVTSRKPEAGSETPRPDGRANQGEIADRILADIDALAPEIVARAGEAEVARRIPNEIIQALKAIGIFRMTAPQSKGGLELDYPAVARIVQRLNRIEGSVGWFGAIRGAAGMVLPRLAKETYDEVYQNGSDIMFSGASQPTGTAEAIDGGWRINGRWPFASGCQDADWICVLCVLTKDGQPIPGPVEGSPATSFVLLRAHDVKIEDTWYASGLKATGSHHVACQDVMTTEKYLFDLATAQPCVAGPLYGAPMQLLTPINGTISLGMAEGALNDVVAMARSGRRQQRAATAMRDSEIVQYELGRAHAKFVAAQMAYDAFIANFWQQAVAGTLNTPDRFTEATQFTIWVSQTCVDVVRDCFTLGGGSAVFESSPLQRRLRDIEVAAQHASIHRQHYAAAGKLLLNRNN